MRSLGDCFEVIPKCVGNFPGLGYIDVNDGTTEKLLGGLRKLIEEHRCERLTIGRHSFSHVDVASWLMCGVFKLWAWYCVRLGRREMEYLYILEPTGHWNFRKLWPRKLFSERGTLPAAVNMEHPKMSSALAMYIEKNPCVSRYPVTYAVKKAKRNGRITCAEMGRAILQTYLMIGGAPTI